MRLSHRLSRLLQFATTLHRPGSILLGPHSAFERGARFAERNVRADERLTCRLGLRHRILRFALGSNQRFFLLQQGLHLLLSLLRRCNLWPQGLLRPQAPHPPHSRAAAPHRRRPSPVPGERPSPQASPRPAPPAPAALPPCQQLPAQFCKPARNAAVLPLRQKPPGQRAARPDISRTSLDHRCALGYLQALGIGAHSCCNAACSPSVRPSC